MKGMVCFLSATIALMFAAAPLALDEVVDTQAQTSIDRLLRGDIRAYATDHLRDIVAPYRTRRITANNVRMDCDGLSITFEVWRPDEKHFSYSVSMPLAVKLANHTGEHEFLARCDVPGCMKTTLSLISPTGPSDEERAASFLQIITRDDKGRRAIRQFHAVRKSCAERAPPSDDS